MVLLTQTLEDVRQGEESTNMIWQDLLSYMVLYQRLIPHPPIVLFLFCSTPWCRS